MNVSLSSTYASDQSVTSVHVEILYLYKIKNYN